MDSHVYSLYGALATKGGLSEERFSLSYRQLSSLKLLAKV